MFVKAFCCLMTVFLVIGLAGIAFRRRRGL